MLIAIGFVLIFLALMLFLSPGKKRQVSPVEKTIVKPEFTERDFERIHREGIKYRDMK